MKRKFIEKKLGLIIIGSCSVFVFCSLLYFSGVIGSVYNGQNSPLLSFVAQSAHTGLNSPSSQVAFNDQNKNGNQFASNSQNTKQNEGSQVADSGNMPTVLFDISAQPIFSKTNSAMILLWAIAFLLVFFVVASAIYKAYKKARIKKIKGN